MKQQRRGILSGETATAVTHEPLCSQFCILLVVIGNQTIASASVRFDSQPDANAAQPDLLLSERLLEPHEAPAGGLLLIFFSCTV